MAPNTADLGLLTTLAEHRALTPAQLADATGRNRQALSRRIAALLGQGMLESEPRRPRGRRGRPQRVLTLTPAAAEALRDRGVLPGNVPDRCVVGVGARKQEHQLLVNAWRARLARLERGLRWLETRFLAPDSPFLAPEGREAPYIGDRVTLPGRAEAEGFVPDGVFVLHHRERGLSLLFFLEADTGSQPLSGGRLSVRHKLRRYQCYFRAAGYKRYERDFGAELNGFRLLLLTAGAERRAKLEALVRDNTPGDFVWVSDANALEAGGAAGRIWARGGARDRPAESLLGTETDRALTETAR